MRFDAKVRAVLAAFVFAGVAVAISTAHPGPALPPPREPFPRATLRPISMPTIAPSAPVATPPALVLPLQSAAPGASPQPQLRGNLALQSQLGPPVPLGRFPRLPKQTARNTLAAPLAGGRRTLSATATSISYSTVSNCGASVGTIFNVGCVIQFQLAYCNPNNPGANCYGGYYSINPTDTFQDYYIDATSATAQTIGTPYTPNANGDYGPSHQLTLANQGTYVLASYDQTAGAWVTAVYVTVGSASGLATFADPTLIFPSTNFNLPTGGGTTDVYINAVGGLASSDTYVVYIEPTAIDVNCAWMVGVPGPYAAGPCNPNLAAGVPVTTLSSGQLQVQVTWAVTSGYAPGSYSVVLWDKTAQRRIAQSQVDLVSAAAGTVTITPIGGNPSPNPQPVATPGSRFAFDNTSDESDYGFTMTVTGLNSSDYYCFTISNPNGTVIQQYANGNENFLCGFPGGGTLSIVDQFMNTESPINFAPNSYTVQAYDYYSNAIGGSGAFQVLGYNATTDFTNAGGTSVTGTALVLPGGSNATAGLRFANDGDSFYGTNNGDTLSGVYFSTGRKGITLTLACNCAAETVVDSMGQSWNVSVTQVGGGSNAGTNVTILPATPGQHLAMGATITLPNLTFYNAPGNSNCSSGKPVCTGETSILPTDGLTWSPLNSSAASNPVYFTNAGTNTYAGTATFLHLGITNVGTPYVGGTQAGEEDHGYYPRMGQSLYAVDEPFAAPNTYADVYSLLATNDSTATTGNITQLAITYPPLYSTGSLQTIPSVDGSSPTAWRPMTCPSGFSTTSTFCIQTNGSNTGIAPGTNQTIYIDLQNLPPSSFSYTDFSIQALKPVAYTLTPDPAYQQTVLVGSSNPEIVDATAVGAYSLDANLISPSFTPTSVGTNTNNPVTVSVQNTSTSADPFPDYLDAIVVQLPNGIANPSNFTGLTTGWSYVGNSPGSGSTTDYWFGLCAAQFNPADGPAANPPPVNPALPSCGSAVEQSSLAPGATFQFTGNMNVGSAAGTIAAAMYAHGANGNGWSKAHTFNLNVTPVAATAGFVNAGTYGSPPAIPQGAQPQIGADSNTTYGNSFVYQIDNTSSSGNNVNSATITIPGTDLSGVNGYDGTTNWDITAAPTLSGTGWTHCAVTAYTSATSGGGNGQIVIGNDGSGTCTLTPNGKLNVNFPMKAPYKINDTFEFRAVVNGTVDASENWQKDTYMQVVLTAQLVISVWPTPGPGGSNPVPSCTLACSYVQASNQLDFGSIANAQANTGTDVALVSVYTDAANPVGWNLYVSTNNNPANTGTPANELLTAVDQGTSSTGTGLTFDQTTLATIPMTSPGLTLVGTPAGGLSPRRIPYDIVNTYQVNIQGGTTTGQTSVITYTFISN